MTAIFEKSDEWGGFTVAEDVAGFLVEYHTHEVGEVDGLKVLVPYGTWGFVRHTALDAPHDEIASNGEALAEMARRDAALPQEERTVAIVDEGVLLSKAKRRAAPPPAPPEKGEAAEVSVPRDASRWYSFSLRKDDDAGYGRCHDLFTEMHLTHGLPHGMALWTTSNYDTDENVFFAEIPAGTNVANDDFFHAFPLAECDRPSPIGLSLLVGHRREEPGGDAPKMRRPWRLEALKEPFLTRH